MKTSSRIRLCVLALHVLAPLSMSASAQTDGTTSNVLPSVLDLNTACALATEHNPAIQTAKEAIRSHDGTVMSERASGLPQLAVIGNYQSTDKGRIESFGGASEFNDQTWSTDLQLSQSLFSGGRLHYTLKAEGHMTEALHLSLEDTTQAVIRDTTERFHAVLLAKEQISVFEESVSLLSNELMLSSNRLAAGTGQRFDVLSAEVALRNEQPLLLRARYDYESAIDALRQTIGLRVSDTAATGITVVDPPDAPLPSQDETASQVTAMALETRPSLLAAEKEVMAGEDNMSVAKRGHMPSVDAYGSYGVQNRQFADNLTDTLDGWRVGVQLNWPIFDSQLTKGDVTVASSLLTEKRIAQEAAAVAVENDVRRELNACKTAYEILGAADCVIEQATEALRLARNRTETGVGTQQEVLDAQVGLSRARLQKAAARYSYNSAAARLRYARGVTPQP